MTDTLRVLLCVEFKSRKRLSQVLSSGRRREVRLQARLGRPRLRGAGAYTVPPTRAECRVSFSSNSCASATPGARLTLTAVRVHSYVRSATQTTSPAKSLVIEIEPALPSRISRFFFA